MPGGFTVKPMIKRLILRSAQKYGLKPWTLAGLIEQESGFKTNYTPQNFGGPAYGITMFIPSTAHTYNVQYGSDPHALKTQIFGAGHLLKDLGAHHDLANALGNYYGDPSSSYASEVIAKSKKYKSMFKGMNVPGGGGGGSPMAGAPTTGGVTNPYADPQYQASKMMADLASSANELPATQAGFQQLAEIALQKASVQPTGVPGHDAGGMKPLGSHADGYVLPFDISNMGRVDQGVDFVGSGPIKAIGDAKILQVGAPGWPGGGGVLYKLLNGPMAGHIVFVFEGVHAKVKVGDKVHAGQVIASFVPGGSIEIGWADANGVPLSHANYTEGKVTGQGKKFQRFLRHI